MDIRAAVAHKAGAPLTIETVQLQGPKAGEVLVEIKATGICHTDEFTRSGSDPEGLFPAILGHEGAGVVVEVGPGVASVKKGDHVIPLYTPECRQCEYCLSGKTNLCQAIRVTQGQGVMPDGSSRFSLGGKKLFHYMGTSTFANYTVVPEIALAKLRPDAPFDKVCYIGCGVTTGIGAVINTAKVGPGANVVVFGLGGIGLNVVQGARMVGASMIVGVDLNPAREALGRKFGMTHFVNPETLEGKDLVAHLVELTDGGADYSFECVGNTRLMRQALECCHRGWGKSVIIGVAGPDRLVGSVHTWIVKTPKHTILIDTCLGNHKQRTNPGWRNLDTPFLSRLKACGCPPESVDFVMCTHLHVDHVGWNTRLENGRWVPTFPKARYLFSRKELDFWGAQSNKAEI